MNRTRIKFCGITRAKDGVEAAKTGADAIGLVFYSDSSRAVSVEQAAEIVRALPPLVTVVGLFVNPSSLEVEETLAGVPLDLLQFHGDETAEFCEGFGKPYLKAVRMRDETVLPAALRDYDTARGLLVDAYTPDAYGGTGKTFRWDILPSNPPKPLILAGGLCSDNVASAIAQVRPWAVDVSGGIEASPGIKCPRRMRQFVNEVYRVDETD